MTTSNALINQIEKKKRIISGFPDYFLRRKNRLKRELSRTCDMHSFWIEHPELRDELLDSPELSYQLEGQKNPRIRQIKEISHRSTRKIERAWDYLQSIGPEGRFTQEFNPTILLKVGQILYPEANVGFRSQRVSINFTEYVPPNPVRVSELVDKLGYMINLSTMNPIDIAISAHRDITGIQPFYDGNKRTGRLIQNRILDDYGLPIACIPSGERRVYLDLLEQALVAEHEKKTKPQRYFFDYIAGKVNVALDEILKDLK